MQFYLDICCLNRPFDDQSQERIHREAEAVIEILNMIASGRHVWVTSEVMDVEVLRSSNAEQQRRILALMGLSHMRVMLGQREIDRARQIEGLGFQLADALHIACAEKGNAEILLTTDDKFLRRSVRLSNQLSIRVANPFAVLEELRQ